MQFRNLFLALIVLTQSCVSARKEWQTPMKNTKENIAENSCYNVGIKKYTWGTEKTKYKSTCSYAPHAGSFLLCLAYVYGNETQSLDKIYSIFTDMCIENNVKGNFSEATTEKIYQNATKYYVPGSSVKNKSIPLYSPVLFKSSDIDPYVNQLHSTYYNFDMGTYFGGILLAYFGLVMAVATVFNFLTTTGVIQKLKGPFFNKFRSYITTPALFPNGKLTQPSGGWYIFTSLIPNRLDALIGFGYTIIHIAVWTSDYRINDIQVNFTSAYQQTIRAVADRTGIVAFAEVPLLILFAGRNNILSFFTGFSQSSFIQFHKLTARFMFLDVMLHSVLYIMRNGHKFFENLHKLYYACGVAATVLSAAVCVSAIHPVRNYAYETFLYTHIIMVVGFIIMCWIHCRYLGWCEWIIAASVFWGFDRFIRVLRVCFFGFHKAQLSVINDDSFKLVVPKPKHFQCKPGQHAFVYFADPLLWFQSHPFTISTSDDDKSLIFYIKSKRGITRVMYNKLLVNNGSLTKTVTIEGPYGESSPIAKYDNALLVAGGAGVPGIIDHAVKLSKANTNKFVKFIWVHQSMDKIQEFAPELLKLKDTNVQVDIYLTRGGPSTKSDNSSSSDEEDKSLEKAALSAANLSNENSSTASSSLDFINWQYGRPNMFELLGNEMATIESGSVGVVSCGPPAMVDSLRAACSQMTGLYKDRFDYFEEVQAW